VQAALNGALGFDAMVAHEFLDSDRTRERCEYSGGIAVEVDHVESSYRILGDPRLEATALSPAASQHTDMQEVQP
jgi:hypothetical protein